LGSGQNPASFDFRGKTIFYDRNPAYLRGKQGRKIDMRKITSPEEGGRDTQRRRGVSKLQKGDPKV